MFIRRRKELRYLEDEYSKDKYSLTVIYGRRRVGKTSLIKEFIRDKKYIYFLATDTSEEINLRNLSVAVGMCFNMEGINFSDFESCFKFISLQSDKEKIVFVIDEFSYLAESVKGISSILQRSLDEYFREINISIILCGSSMSFMEKQVLGARSPLYGRRTGQMKIRPFDFEDTLEMLEGADPVDIAVYYGVTGGVSEYLKFIDIRKTIDDNLISLFFKNTGRLYEEPQNLLNQELREPRLYNDIIYAIAGGASKNNEICAAVSKTSSEINPYLVNLSELQIVGKIDSVSPFGSKKGVYRISDFMYRFWYKFVGRGRPFIELSEGEAYYSNMVKPFINEYMGHIFEEIAAEYMMKMSAEGKLGDFIIESGIFRGTDKNLKKEVEIDFLGTGKKYMHLGEAKWRNEPTGIGVSEDLYIKGNMIPGDKKYYIFSKNGFTKELVKRKEDVNLVSFEDIVRYLKERRREKTDSL